MIRLISPRRLEELGIMGMNRRNIGFIGKYNPRRNYPLVDDKLLTKKAALENDIPAPELYAVIEAQHQIARATRDLAERGAFVIKPVQGSGGKGILVITGREGESFRKSSGTLISAAEVRRHLSNILAGLYSLGGRNDKAMVEAMIQFDPYLEKYSYEGVPDVRVIAFRGVPVMAMVRCATHASDGKANLHQGAVGVGIDIETGRTLNAVLEGKCCTQHPDTGRNLIGIAYPNWEDIRDVAVRAAKISGLGYTGVDVVMDDRMGPAILEINARPGLDIQIANGAGLRQRVHEVFCGSHTGKDL